MANHLSMAETRDPKPESLLTPPLFRNTLIRITDPTPWYPNPEPRDPKPQPPNPIPQTPDPKP